MNKRFTILIAVFCVIMSVYKVIICLEDFFLPFEQSTNLNYNGDVTHIKIVVVNSKPFMKNSEVIIIDDSKDIYRIIEYLNSLELVSRYIPDDYTYYDVDFYLYIFKDGQFETDEIIFMKRYLAFNADVYDRKKETDYFIKNSGYNPVTKGSKPYQFLFKLINS